MKYFKIDDFKCKCGCGLNNISEELLEKLDNAREDAGIPFVINSACRCEKHNKREGGAISSKHLTGMAVDIKTTTSIDRYKIVKSLIKNGFVGIGIANTFVHADIDRTSPLIFLYR